MPKKTKHTKDSDKKKAWYKKQIKYFKSFPVRTANVISYGLGSSKTKLVELAIDARKEDKEEEVWGVFDMDIQPDNAERIKEDYENAIELALSKNIKVAYSNDAFELWFILHYQYFDNQWTRYEYYDKLSELWNCNYEKVGKNIAFAKTIYKRLEEDENADQTQAIGRANKLLENQKDLKYAEKNPSTNVHNLVEELNKHF